MAEVEKCMRQFSDAKIFGNRICILSARLRLAKSYAEAGFNGQAQRHLEIVAQENIFWRAQAAKVQISMSTGDTDKLKKIVASVFGN